jgi:hypothetical protein
VVAADADAHARTNANVVTNVNALVLKAVPRNVLAAATALTVVVAVAAAAAVIKQ